MDDNGLQFVAGLRSCFAELSDPRDEARIDHLLIDILSITVLATLCGAEDWPDYEQFGKSRHQWLAGFLELPNGIPSHDTFRRVLGALERDQFSACLFRWTQALQEASEGKVIAIDGKALRRSLAKKSRKVMLHLVTAWATENGLTLGQVACAEKSNEITAIPELLKLLTIKGCTVTIDAMGCQKEIAEEIRDRQGHYVLAVKGNQPTLEADLQAYFVECLETQFANRKWDYVESRETGHGRIEERFVHAVGLPDDFRHRREWKDLKSLVVVTSHRQEGDKDSWETRYYITDHLPRARQLGQAIRRHWSIENSQHWVLDVTFGEDWRRQRDRNGAANLAAVRRLALSLLRQDTTVKRGIKTKRLKCALDPQYLLQILKPKL
jgi:predicted transposase YbfD/YdcC